MKIDPQSLDLTALPWVPLKATSGFPEDPAIYFAIDAQGTVQYIGRSGNVRTRWKSHHRYRQLEKMGGVKVAYLFVKTPQLLPSLESTLISWFNPPLNVVGRKKVIKKKVTKKVIKRVKKPVSRKKPSVPVVAAVKRKPTKKAVRSPAKTRTQKPLFRAKTLDNAALWLWQKLSSDNH